MSLGPFSARKTAIYFTAIGRWQNLLCFSPINERRGKHQDSRENKNQYNSVLIQAIDENIDRNVRHLSRWLTSILLEFPIYSWSQRFIRQESSPIVKRKGRKHFQRTSSLLNQTQEVHFFAHVAAQVCQNFSQRHSGSLKIDWLACTREIIALRAVKWAKSRNSRNRDSSLCIQCIVLNATHFCNLG